MCKATIDLVSPGGVPVTLEVNNDDEQRTIIEILDRAEKIGVYFGNKGWTFAHVEPLGPSATELAQGPNFAGYNFEWLHRSPRFRDHYLSHDQTEHYEYMKTVLKIFQWQDVQAGGQRKRFVTKCPRWSRTRARN